MIAQDKFKALGVDDTIDLRAFKGHCKIELTDVNTGKVETVEHDNMVTKALEYFFRKGGITNRSAFNASYINSNMLYYLLGGVMCLDTAIEENAEIIRVPSGIGMTANGARDVSNNTNPTELGTYNDVESGWQNDGSFKMVWDWTTSQGNGTINSVCLTSIYAGMAGIGNKSLTSKGNSFSAGNYNSATGLSGYEGIPLGYYDNKLYCLQAVAGVEKWTIKRYDFPYTQVDVRDTMTARLIDEIEVSIPSTIQNLRAGDGSASTYARYDAMRVISQKGTHTYMLIMASENSYVGAYWREYFDDSNPWYAVDYDMSTGTVTAIALTPTNTGIPALGSGQGVNYLGGISDKWVVIGNTAVEKANLANAVEMSDAPTGTTDYNNRYIFMQDTDIFTWHSGNGWRYDVVAEKACPTNGGYLGGQGNLADNPLMRFTGNALYRDYGYIATIFNLDSPKVKDASKMMKVTYLLRFS